MKRRVALQGVALLLLGTGARGESKLPLVAILSPASRDGAAAGLVHQPFKEALVKLGLESGRTIEIVERFADRDESRLPALAAELVALKPRVLFTNTSSAAAAAARATRTIPIVVGPAGELVLRQLAGGNLARPTTNVTGFVLTSPDIDTKVIALLLEAAPATRRIGLLVNPRNPGQKQYPAQQRATLGRPDVTLVRLEASGPNDIDTALSQAGSQRVDALFVADDSHLAANPTVRDRVLRFAASARIPVASSHQDYARRGALLAMGPSIPVLAARAAGYVAKILEGSRPADLPVELPTVFTTIVNLRTAEALGITLSSAMLLRADELVR